MSAARMKRLTSFQITRNRLRLTATPGSVSATERVRI
jgi:hypothetical protein